jgi:hypothetical protein
LNLPLNKSKYRMDPGHHQQVSNNRRNLPLIDLHLAL